MAVGCSLDIICNPKAILMLFRWMRMSSTMCAISRKFTRIKGKRWWWKNAGHCTWIRSWREITDLKFPLQKWHCPVRKMLYLASFRRKIADPTTAGLQEFKPSGKQFILMNVSMINIRILIWLLRCCFWFKLWRFQLLHARTSGKHTFWFETIWYMMDVYSVLAVVHRCKVLKMDARSRTDWCGERR